ncbi:MAG: hypothetical protein BWK80_05775 [Desulfobacteraceae bacterium IS3]|nr:MAG: hypothetical protein BWK80_05775 [Desulfobacteraceae bacterium IS3]HAO23492.1 hypothetical protein [Desulfobacteraceae bacterium]
MAFATFVGMLKIIAVLAAGMVVGSSYLDEVRKAKLKGEPWYKPYQTLPGILVIVFCIVLPFVVWYLKNR